MTALVNQIPKSFASQRTQILPRDGVDSDEDAWARIAWSTFIEPGDRIAGLLISAFGPREALSFVLGDVSSKEIINKFATDFELQENTHTEIEDALKRWQPLVSISRIESVTEHAIGIGAYVITPEMNLWPHGLNDLHHHAPVVLWVRGSEDVATHFQRSISIVGARASTGYGEHVTMTMVNELVEQGFSIVSGAAYGIDGMAHRSALSSGGTTMAYLAGGVDRFYPSGHEAMLGRMATQGLVLSEVPCGVAPTKWRFLQRNRLIAASTQATVVIEAGWRSGSLNTANHAATIGRPLGAVPGPVISATSAGCHRLLREYDAQCVTNAEEVLELLSDAVMSDC